jgi:hypothetical protein
MRRNTWVGSILWVVLALFAVAIIVLIISCGVNNSESNVDNTTISHGVLVIDTNKTQNATNDTVPVINTTEDEQLVLEKQNDNISQVSDANTSSESSNETSNSNVPEDNVLLTMNETVTNTSTPLLNETLPDMNDSIQNETAGLGDIPIDTNNSNASVSLNHSASMNEGEDDNQSLVAQNDVAKDLPSSGTEMPDVVESISGEEESIQSSFEDSSPPNIDIPEVPKNTKDIPDLSIIDILDDVEEINIDDINNTPTSDEEEIPQPEDVVPEELMDDEEDEVEDEDKKCFIICTDDPNFSRYVSMAVVLLIIIIILVVLSGHRIREKKEEEKLIEQEKPYRERERRFHDDLQDEVEEMLADGSSEKKIREILKKHKWSEATINSVFEKINKK